MGTTGVCKHCNHEPVATTAKKCPKCHGEHPIKGAPSWLVMLWFIGGFGFVLGLFWLVFVVLE